MIPNKSNIVSLCLVYESDQIGIAREIHTIKDLNLIQCLRGGFQFDV